MDDINYVISLLVNESDEALINASTGEEKHIFSEKFETNILKLCSQAKYCQPPQGQKRHKMALKSIYSAMVDDGIDEETLKELQQMIEEKMRKLGE